MLNIFHSNRSLRHSLQFLLGLILSLGLFLAGVGIPIAKSSISVANAQGKAPFYWESINVDIDVQKDGDMLIEEEQTYVFKSSSHKKLYQTIPLSKVDEVTHISVREEGEVIPHKTEIKNNRLWIRWGGERITPGNHTFLIEYCVVGGLRQKKQSTQVYWNAIAPNRLAPVQSGRVTVNLPDELNGKVSSYKTYGIPTITEVTDKNRYMFFSNKRLLAGQKLDVKINVPLNALPHQWQIQRFKRTQKIYKDVYHGFQVYFTMTCVLNYIYLSLSIGSSGDASRIAPEHLLIGFISALGWVYLPFILAVKTIKFIREAIARRKSKICPKCQSPTLVTRSLLFPATTQMTGTHRIIKECQHCEYHSESEQSIPKLPVTSSGSG